MAKVIDYYTAVVTGGATIYCYQQPDDTSPATRVYQGTAARLPADYAARGRNQMLPVLSPVDGWMFYWNLTDIYPVETNVTDPCVPPTFLTVNMARTQLVITGGSGTDGNELTGFGVSYRERAADASEWGAWSADTVTTSREVAVSAAAGKVRQYRARTRGTAGSQYFSSYVVCQSLVFSATLDGVPVVEVPANGAVTFCSKPLVRVTSRAAQDGSRLRLMRSVDGGSWVERKEFVKDISIPDDLPTLAAGAHTIRYRLEKTDGTAGDEVSLSITVRNRSWLRDVYSGAVLASRKISHRAEIEEMLAAVNALRAFYGMEAITLPGSVGNLADWKSQMKALQQGIGQVRQAMEQQEHTWRSAPGWPEADTVVEIRHQSVLI